MRSPLTRRQGGTYVNVEMHHAPCPSRRRRLGHYLPGASAMSRPSTRSCSSASPRGAERAQERIVRCIDLDAVWTPYPRQIPAHRRSELELDDTRGFPAIQET